MGNARKTGIQISNLNSWSIFVFTQYSLLFQIRLIYILILEIKKNFVSTEMLKILN